MLQEALYKRKPFLDSFSEGLQVLGVKDMIRHFPGVFKPAYVFFWSSDTNRCIENTPT